MNLPKSTMKSALNWWEKNGGACTRLHQLALKILPTPASSATIERIFSIAALSCGTKNQRARLQDIKMSKETILSANSSFVKLK